jgi:hypothetical protein
MVVNCELDWFYFFVVCLILNKNSFELLFLVCFILIDAKLIRNWRNIYGSFTVGKKRAFFSEMLKIIREFDFNCHKFT